MKVYVDELTIGFLVEYAHPHITDNLSRQAPTLSFCVVKSET
ncbi:hypothetical protein M2194_009115 [Bradyrhizobium elkanii]|nr:hypothetical protein [Bradyrhizobium elkanii]